MYNVWVNKIDDELIGFAIICNQPIQSNEFDMYMQFSKLQKKVTEKWEATYQQNKDTTVWGQKKARIVSGVENSEEQNEHNKIGYRDNSNRLSGGRCKW